MERMSVNKKKWIIFSSIIIALAVLVAVCPIIIARHMKIAYKAPAAEFMIKVKGVIKRSDELEKKVYLKGDNGLYYILIGDKTEELLKNLNKSITLFGNIIAVLGESGVKKETVEGNPVRMRINVVKFDLD